MIASSKHIKFPSFYEGEGLNKNSFDIKLEDELYKKSGYVRLYEENSLPENHVIIINRLENIIDLIQNKVAAKEDIKTSTREIIKSQKIEIAEAKVLIKDLIKELQQRSTANIFILISGIGLIISLCLLTVSIFNTEIRLTYFHFTISSIAFSLVLIMSFISKKNINE